MEKETNHQLQTDGFVHHRIVSAVKRVELVHDRMSYIILWGHCCNIIILNVHAPSDKKSDNSKDGFYEESKQVFYHFPPKYHMKILLEDFNAKLWREDIVKPTNGNDNLHHNNNDKGVRIVNFATVKNLAVKSTMFPHQNIHKYSWISPEGKTHNQTDHILYQVM